MSLLFARARRIASFSDSGRVPSLATPVRSIEGKGGNERESFSEDSLEFPAFFSESVCSAVFVVVMTGVDDPFGVGEGVGVKPGRVILLPVRVCALTGASVIVRAQAPSTTIMDLEILGIRPPLASKLFGRFAGLFGWFWQYDETPRGGHA